MEFKEYQKLTSQFAIYPKETALEYLSLGLFSEVGEIAGLIKKKIRGDSLPDFDDLLKKELGDVAWYLSEFCNHVGIDSSNTHTLLKKSEKWSIMDSLNTIDDLIYECRNIIVGVTYDRDDLAEDVLNTMDALINMILLFGFDVEEILDINIKKLSSRQERCVIKGSGDNR